MTIGFFLLGLGFLGYRGYIHGGDSSVIVEDSLRLGWVDTFELDIELILNAHDLRFVGDLPDLDEAEVLAVFVLNTAVCPPCINEVAEYAALFEEQHAHLPRFQGVVLMDGLGEHSAENFIRIINLPIASAHGDLSVLKGTLDNTGTPGLIKQILFVDIQLRRAFFRSRLYSAKQTSPEFKREVLAHVGMLYDNINQQQ